MKPKTPCLENYGQNKPPRSPLHFWSHHLDSLSPVSTQFFQQCQHCMCVGGTESQIHKWLNSDASSGHCYQGLPLSSLDFVISVALIRTQGRHAGWADLGSGTPQMNSSIFVLGQKLKMSVVLSSKRQGCQKGALVSYLSSPMEHFCLEAV